MDYNKSYEILPEKPVDEISNSSSDSYDTFDYVNTSPGLKYGILKSLEKNPENKVANSGVSKISPIQEIKLQNILINDNSEDRKDGYTEDNRRTEKFFEDDVVICQDKEKKEDNNLIIYPSRSSKDVIIENTINEEEKLKAEDNLERKNEIIVNEVFVEESLSSENIDALNEKSLNQRKKSVDEIDAIQLSKSKDKIAENQILNTEKMQNIHYEDEKEALYKEIENPKENSTPSERCSTENEHYKASNLYMAKSAKKGDNEDHSEGCCAKCILL